MAETEITEPRIPEESAEVFDVTLRFELHIPKRDRDEILFLGGYDSDSTDLNMAVWDYITNWVKGSDKDRPERPRSCVKYTDCHIEKQEHDCAEWCPECSDQYAAETK